MGKSRINILGSKHIKLDIALRTVNEKGCILRKDILNTLKVGQVVRISLHVSKNSPYDCRQTTDSPYVKICEMKDSKILGEILEEFRTLPDNYYPLLAREKIWFSRANIIGLINLSQEDEQKYATKEFVAYTGPLELIDLDDQSETDSDSDDESASSESDAERESIELKEKDKKAPIPRGRPYNK